MTQKTLAANMLAHISSPSFRVRKQSHEMPHRIIRSSKELLVTIKRSEKVAPDLPLQEHWMPITNLDLFIPPTDVGVFFCYKQATVQHDAGHYLHLTSIDAMIERLKQSLAQALVMYYPFAGEVVDTPSGQYEVFCSSRGVDFVETYANLGLSELDLYDADSNVEGKLVPRNKGGVLSVQDTVLKCGGLVAGLTFDHRVADAFSTNMFLVAWAECARSKPISATPSFRRSLLHPRRSARYHPSLSNLYITSSSLPPPVSPTSPSHRLVSRIYHITAADINRLQSLANSYPAKASGKRTKIEAFTAFLWQTLAKGMTSFVDQRKLFKIGVDGDWVVYMRMMRWQVEVVEEARDVLKPLTCSYWTVAQEEG